MVRYGTIIAVCYVQTGFRTYLPIYTLGVMVAQGTPNSFARVRILEGMPADIA